MTRVVTRVSDLNGIKCLAMTGHGTGSRYKSDHASQTVANTTDVNDLASVISPGAPPDGPDGRAVLEPPPSPSQPYSKNKKMKGNYGNNTTED